METFFEKAKHVLGWCPATHDGECWYQETKEAREDMTHEEETQFTLTQLYVLAKKSNN